MLTHFVCKFFVGDDDGNIQRLAMTKTANFVANKNANRDVEKNILFHNHTPKSCFYNCKMKYFIS